ncbi:MAG: GAF domain-containing protein [Chloroflexi bacterium]|nr:GAF domain-containing protein [Chloroflexota bacterium]
MGLTRLKWLTIVVPAVILVAFDYLRHFVFPYDYLHGWSGLLLVSLLALSGAAVFSHAIFVLIGRAEREVLRRNQELAATADVATALGQSLRLNEILKVALDKVLQMLAVEAGTVCVLDETKEELVHLVCQGMPPEVLAPLTRAKLSHDPIGSQVVETGQPAVLTNLWGDPRLATAAKKAGFRSAVSVPLKAEGKVVGVMAIVSVGQRSFSSSEVAMLIGIGSQLGMAVRNAVLFEDLVRRNRELAVHNTVAAAVGSSLDLGQVMVAAVDSVVELTEAEAGEIWLLDETRQELALTLHRGLRTEAFHEIDRFPVGEGLPGLVAQTGEPIVTQDLLSEASPLRGQVKGEGFRFFACLPLKARGRVVGTLAIASRTCHELTSRDLQLLGVVGNQIGVAIENAALHRKVQNLAVLEERERIAREMHDGLGQILGYVNTKTQAVRRLLTLGQKAEAEQALGQLEEASREVYADVREAIVSLRTTTSSNGGLVPALKEYLEWFSRQNAIRTELNLGDIGDGALDATVEVQLIRIVQEALSNVRKHARASQARVHLSTVNGSVCLTVEDDGQGFEPGHVARGAWPQFGLRTMRERAESVGGAFEVDSAPGQGARVNVRIPKGASLR